MKTTTLWESQRLRMDEAMALTFDSLREYGPKHDHWAVAWSGGKDSTAMLTLLLYGIANGDIEAPDALTLLYADTRQELPPLYAAATAMIDLLKERGVDVRVCVAPMHKRFLVYILGLGVPPPSNTMRWCTGSIKVDPMANELASMVGGNASILTITGMRIGESQARDQRIALACGRNGGECGQGWYQEVLPNSKGIRGQIATLSPLLHWRVCHVWDWLAAYAPQPAYGGYPTAPLAIAYGGEEAEEINARTGCIGCPLISHDKTLDTILRQPGWGCLEPLKEVRPLYRELRKPENRLRKASPEILKDGSWAKNPQRMGPLTLAAREMGLDRPLPLRSALHL